MRPVLITCIVCIIFSISCVSTKPGFDRKNVLWLDHISRLNACETYDQFKSVASNLGFYFKADVIQNDVRILTYTRDVYVAKTKRTSTQVLGFYINMYIPRVVFATPHTAYPFYNRDFKAEAAKNSFTISSGTDENFTMIRVSDQAKFTMMETYDPKNGLTTYTLSF